MFDSASGSGGCAPNELVQVLGLVIWLLPTAAERSVRFVGVFLDGGDGREHARLGGASSELGFGVSLTRDLPASPPTQEWTATRPWR
jgi:hypothetical protein